MKRFISSPLYLKFTTIFLVSASIMLGFSCSHSGDGLFSTIMESQTGSHKSRDMDGNCMNCHSINGGGGSNFTIGGTVYKDDLKTVYPNVTIKFFTQPNGGGELIKTLAGDALGNFYSTQSLAIGKNLYPLIDNGKGETRSMSTSISTGSCNSCHGISTDFIHLK